MNDDTTRHEVPLRRVGRVFGAVLAATAVAVLTAGCPGSGSDGGGGGYGSTEGETHPERSEQSGESAPADQR